MHVVQVFHTRTEPHAFAGFNHAQNVQIYIVCRDHPSFKRSIIGLTVIGLTGMIQKGKARRVDSADTVCVREYHLHSNVDGLRVLPAEFLSPRRHHFVHPWSVRWEPIRFERMATVLITDCVHTPGDCTRSSTR